MNLDFHLISPIFNSPPILSHKTLDSMLAVALESAQEEKVFCDAVEKVHLSMAKAPFVPSVSLLMYGY